MQKVGKRAHRSVTWDKVPLTSTRDITPARPDSGFPSLIILIFTLEPFYVVLKRTVCFQISLHIRTTSIQTHTPNTPLWRFPFILARILHFEGALWQPEAGVVLGH